MRRFQRSLAHALLALVVSTPAVAVAGELELALSHRGSGTLYMTSDLSVDGDDLWLVDTGSDHSVIDQSAFEMLSDEGRITFVRNLRARLADGTIRKIPLYRVDRIRFGGHCELSDLEIAVLPTGKRRIIGLSALRQMAPFAFHFDPPRLAVNGCTATPTAAALSADAKTPPVQDTGGAGYKPRPH